MLILLKVILTTMMSFFVQDKEMMKSRMHGKDCDAGVFAVKKLRGTQEFALFATQSAWKRIP